MYVCATVLLSSQGFKRKDGLWRDIKKIQKSMSAKFSLTKQKNNKATGSQMLRELTFNKFNSKNTGANLDYIIIIKY